MLTLSLLRHAKSSWKDPTIPDHDRPLNARGKTEAPLMGKAVAKHGLAPDLVLCSTARRTRDTLELVLPELKKEPKIVYEDGLYHGTPQEMLDLLRQVPPSASQVLLVGHNPELQSFALDLIGQAAADPNHHQADIIGAGTGLGIAGGKGLVQNVEVFVLGPGGDEAGELRAVGFGRQDAPAAVGQEIVHLLAQLGPGFGPGGQDGGDQVRVLFKSLRGGAKARRQGSFAAVAEAGHFDVIAG